MTTLQHERIKTLAHELRLHALPELYGAVAQNAAKREDAAGRARGRRHREDVFAGRPHPGLIVAHGIKQA